MRDRTQALIALIGAFLLKMHCRTLRLRVDDDEGLTRRNHGQFIWAFWHNRLLLIPFLHTDYLRMPRGVAMTSASRDGALLAHFLKHFGIGAARGSSSRRGAAALRELARWIERGYSCAITPDGPRGPRYVLHPGIVRLAQLTGVPVLPISIEFTRFWRLRSWDGFIIPWPFSEVFVKFGKPYHVAQTDNPEAFEAERVKMEKLLLSELRLL